MAEFDGLKFLNERIGELILEYNTALMNNDRRVPELLDELSRLCVLRGELKKTQSVTNEKDQKQPRDARIEFSNLDAVYRHMERHMGRSTICTLTFALMASVGVLLPARSLSAADIELIVRYGQGEAVTEFKNAQPADAVKRFVRSETRSQFFWGDFIAASPRLSFSTSGLIVEEGLRVEANFRKAFALGRLGYLIGGFTRGSEATAVDLQVALTVTQPAGLAEPFVVTLPLTITTFREVNNFGLVGTAGQIGFPTIFPTIEFTAGGAKHRLKVIGFGSVNAEGVVTTVPSLFSGDDVPVDSADLLAVIEPPCPEDPKEVAAVHEKIGDYANCSKDSPGNRIARYGQFGFRDVLEANSGDKLELECTFIPPTLAFFRLLFTPAGSAKSFTVGTCPFEAGCNLGEFYHSGDNDNGGRGDGKPDCFLLTRWTSKDYNLNDKPNPWTDDLDFFENELDWAEMVYSVTSNNLTKRDYKYKYNLGPPVPFSICTQGGQKPEGDLVGTTSLDPPLGPETEAFFDQVAARFAQIPPSGFPMGEDKSKPCDFNGDGRCDAADLQIFGGALDSCRGGAGYHPQADTDGSGCVDAQDRFHLFEADRDGDGIPDTADNCLTAANPSQIDSDGDGEGDVCESGVVGDFDNDGDVDRIDLNILLDWRNTAAAGPNDPKDLDRDGRITALDARKLVLLCTRLNCATQ
jgi:hypothetical protein